MIDVGEPIYDNFYARRYDQLFHDSAMGRERFRFETAEIRRRIRPPAGPESVCLLDLGCGTGRHCAVLSAEFRTTGVDSSPSMLEVARRTSPRTSFLRGDMRDPDLVPEGAFTHVLSLYGAIHYNRELERILANIRRWLCPGGMACLEVLDPTCLCAATSADSRSVGQQAVTQYPDFEYRSRWEHGEGDLVYYHETFVLPWLEIVERRHELYMPRIEVLTAAVVAAGFGEIEMVSLAPVDCSDELLLFARSP